MAHSSAHVQYSYAPATTVGTALAASTATTGLQIKDRPSINPGITLHEVATARNAAYLHTGDVVMTGKAPSFGFSCPVSAYVLADFLYALFQNIVSEAAGTPFIKVFTPAIATVKAIDSGTAVSAASYPHCLDIFQLQNGAAGTDDDFQLISGIPSEITIAMQDGLWHMTATVLGFDSDIKALDYTGPVTNGGNIATAGKKYLANAFVKIGGQPANVQDFSLTIRNGLAMFPYNKGVPQTALLTSQIQSCELTLGVPYDVAETRSLITNADPSATPYAAGTLTPSAMVFILYGPNSSADSPSAADDIAITVRGHVSSITPATGTDQVLTNVTVRATYDGSNAPVSITLADSTDRSWT